MEYKINSSGQHPLSMQQLKENWGWYLILGISLVVLGFLSVVYAFVSTIFSVVFLGFLFVVWGIFEGIKSFKINLWGSFFLHLFLSILYLVAGVFIIRYPVANAVSLTMFLALFFAISGFLKIVFALVKNVPHKGWLLFNGVVTMVLGILIWQQLPVAGLWVIGMLVGIDAMFTGWTWIMLAFAAKNLKNHVGHPHN